MVGILGAVSSAPAEAGQAAPGSIVGRLIDASTGEPIAEGVLVLRDLVSRAQHVVNTGATGEFRLNDLPGASYSLHATALGYVQRQYGQRHPTEDAVPIDLSVGETLANIVVALAPAGGIAGRVTTEDGQPLAFADVEALRPELDGERRVLLPVGHATSNARGEYRIEGLPSGRYYVATLDPDDPGTEDAAGRIQMVQTFFPGVATPATAERVRLSAGGELTNVDFPLVGAARVTVTGQLERPRRTRLATGSVIMSPESNDGLGLGIARPAVVRPDGTFEFSNVPPGNYRLRASARTSRPGPALFGSHPLVVGISDVRDVELVLSPGARLVGVVETDSAVTAPVPPLDGVWVSAPAFDGTMGSGVTRSQVDEEGRFTLETPDGRRIIRLGGLPAPWSLQSVLYEGRNVIDAPFELQFGDERERIRLVITDQASRLTGTVQDEQGHPVTDPAVVALPVDPTRRYVGSAHLRVTYPDRSCRYELVWLPAGGYLLSAYTGIREADLYEVAVFREIAAVGTAVVIEAAERTTLDLTFSRD
jgi:hypothetical protein